MFANLHDIPARTRADRIDMLLHFTTLSPFVGRAAGRLSGGMKQKLGLACALLAQPKLLLLDEPSVGVDPGSRRELWAIVTRMLEAGAADGMGVVWATAYLDEAGRCGKVLLLHEGRLLSCAAPQAVLAPLQGRVFSMPVAGSRRRKAVAEASADPTVLDASLEGDRLRLVLRKGASAPAGLDASSLVAAPPRFEDGFVDLLAGSSVKRPESPPPLRLAGASPAIAVDGLVRRFGAFVAVDHVSFEVPRGEIFGLLGPNGAGKSTIFRMLCGLLPPSEGRVRVGGADLLMAAAEARSRIGYMAQRFSLYGELTALDNLAFFAGVYGLKRVQRKAAIDRALENFDLVAVARETAGTLPLGVKQRLALAAALLHDPDILFLDEPTSGVDPLTRRAFWRQISSLAAAGVTVLVTSHFMDEAENCDRLAIISAGHLIAVDTPAALRARARTPGLPDPTLDDAFIALVDRDREARAA